MKIENIKYNEYLNQFEYISNKIEPAELFKVDLIKQDNKFNTYFNIKNKAVVCVCIISLNTIEIKSLISAGGGAGSALLKYIIKKYSGRYNIILDSFSSNNYFYLKNGFKPYKVISYNPIYDIKQENKNKEPVIYYKYENSNKVISYE